MAQLTKIFAAALFTFFVFGTFAQEKPETEKKETHMKMEHMQSDSTMHGMNHTMNMKTDSMNTNMMVHEGEIDLQAIDKNKDGKVYQDMMDWNVISDEPGKCPLCGMTLKEVSLDKAKENLLKHDFKIKEK